MCVLIFFCYEHRFLKLTEREGPLTGKPLPPIMQELIYAVGARIPNMFGFQMVQSCSVGEWCSDFKCSAILVRFLNGHDHSKTELWVVLVILYITRLEARKLTL